MYDQDLSHNFFLTESNMQISKITIAVQPNNCFRFSVESFFITVICHINYTCWERQALANRADPDQMPLNAASDQSTMIATHANF